MAPTAVLEDCFETELLAGQGAVIETAHLSLPVPGKHICFDGRLLHAAPADLREVFKPFTVVSAADASEGIARSKSKRRKASRTTLLVNIWQRHQPRDPRLLALETAAKLSPVVVASPFSLGCGQCSEPLHLEVGRGVQAQETSWQFGEDDSMSVTLPIPACTSEVTDSITLRFKDGRCGCVG